MNENFFVKFFFQFFFKNFCQNFPQNIFGICFKGFALETHACFEHPTRDFSRDYINEDFLVKFFFQIFFPNFPQNSYNHEKNPAWGTRNTRVSRMRNPRNKCQKNFEKNFDKKIWKKY